MMNRQSDFIRVDYIRGSRNISNFFWATILFFGASGFFLIGFSSYLGKDLIPFLYSQDLLFIPQGIVMCFYGIAGCFLGIYLWCTIFWNVGSGYNYFDKKDGILCIFRWGFPGRNRRILIKIKMNDIKAIKMEIREGFYPRRFLYIKIKGQQYIPLTQLGESFTTLGEMEEIAAELARFLRVSLEG